MQFESKIIPNVIAKNEIGVFQSSRFKSMNHEL